MNLINRTISNEFMCCLQCLMESTPGERFLMVSVRQIPSFDCMTDTSYAFSEWRKMR